MATYGSIPGVRISTSTGTVSGVTIGRSQYLLLVGAGNQDATVTPSEPVQIDGRADVDEKFGAGSDVAGAYRRALANGASPDLIRGIRAPTTTQSGETFTANTGTLAETPVVSDVDRMSVENGTGDPIDVTFDWESPPAAADGTNVVRINPYTGEFDSDVSDITFEYESVDFGPAFTAGKGVLTEGEFGVINPLTSSAEVGTTLQGHLSEMRANYKMVVGVLGAEYNGTLVGGQPELNPAEFTNTFSDDTLFTVGPTALGAAESGTGLGVEALGAAAGLFAGNATTEPIYDNTIAGIGPLEQDVTRADVTDLRGERVIPLRDTGIVRLEDNRSTYDQETEGGWERDYFRRRIVDLTSVTLYLIARQQIGGILDGDTVNDVQDAVDVQLSDLVSDGLLEAGEQDATVYREDDRTIGMDVVITPLGVAKGADISLEINA